jgi:hypothetical protein
LSSDLERAKPCERDHQREVIDSLIYGLLTAGHSATLAPLVQTCNPNPSKKSAKRLTLKAGRLGRGVANAVEFTGHTAIGGSV